MLFTPDNEVYKVDFLSVWHRLSELRKPTIAAVSGYALGGGCEIALMCDIVSRLVRTLWRSRSMGVVRHLCLFAVGLLRMHSSMRLLGFRRASRDLVLITLVL